MSYRKTENRCPKQRLSVSVKRRQHVCVREKQCLSVGKKEKKRMCLCKKKILTSSVRGHKTSLSEKENASVRERGGQCPWDGSSGGICAKRGWRVAGACRAWGVNSFHRRPPI